MIEYKDWKKEYAYELSYIGNSEKIAQMQRDNFPSPYTLDKANEFIIKSFKKKEQGIISKAIFINGKLAGVAECYSKNDFARYDMEIGYWLGEMFWNQGYGTQIVKDITNFIFTEYSNIRRITAEVFSNNISSIKVLENNNYKKEGIIRKAVFKNNQFYDMLIFGILREENNKK